MYHLPFDPLKGCDERHKKERLHQSYAKGNFDSRTGDLVAKDDGDFPTLVSNGACDPLKPQSGVLPFEIVSMTILMLSAIPVAARIFFLFHDTFVAIIEHQARPHRDP